MALRVTAEGQQLDTCAAGRGVVLADTDTRSYGRAQKARTPDGGGSEGGSEGRLLLTAFHVARRCEKEQGRRLVADWEAKSASYRAKSHTRSLFYIQLVKGSL